MKSPLPSLGKAIQRALQLDLFSDFLVSERLRSPTPQPGRQAAQPPATLQPPPQLPSAETDIERRAGDLRRVQLQGTWLTYQLQRSKRRSIGFLINEDGLRITAPRWVTLADIEKAIHEKQTWILRKLAERRELTARRARPVMQWCDGARLPYLGNEITLRITPASASGTHFRHEASELIISLPHDASEQQLKDRVQAWLQQEARREFNQRLPIFAEKLNVRYHSMALSAATTRWGSCTSQGKIRLNWRLIHFSPQIIDYVVAHELAHLREMNHSPRFWATVQSVFPDFEIARHQLRQHASADLPDF
jgi:predicted metal-dependent hydrolase